MRPRIYRNQGRWHVARDCGCVYSSPNPARVHDEARWHQHPPILGPRWLDPDTTIAADVTRQAVWTPYEERP